MKRREMTMKGRVGRIFVAVAAMTLTGVGAAGTAQAEHVTCGQTITQNTALHADVGPCPNGGIIIGADNITLDLRGFRIFGTPATGDGAGVYLLGRTRVTVTNGSVSNFDGGVVIEGGSGNTVSNIRAFDNIGAVTARFGDGIAIESSKDNRIVRNTTENNGPYSGIGLYTLIDANHPRQTSGVSSGNLIDSNIVRNNVVSRSGVPSSTDNDGIRVENNSTGNTITRNTVTGNGLDGIALFRAAADNVLRFNTVEGNGFFRVAARRGSGIIVFNEANNTVIENNVVRNNADNGIAIRGPLGAVPGSVNNVIRGNLATGNAATPALPSGAFGPPISDLNDRNPNCDNNTWLGNRYGTAIPACTANGGRQVV